MTRETCIAHRPKQAIAIIRRDYFELMSRDCVAAALLNEFEHRANGVFLRSPDIENPWLGEITTKEFEAALLGIATDKHIRKRLKALEEKGYIQTRQPVKHRKTLEYRLMVTTLQADLNALTEPYLNSSKPSGQTTVGPSKPSGQTTVDPAVKQPLGSQNPAVKRPLHYIQDLNKELDQLCIEQNEQKPLHTQPSQPVMVEVVTEPEIDNTYPFVTQEINESNQDSESSKEPGASAGCDNKRKRCRWLVSEQRVDELEDLLDSGADIGYTTQDELKALCDRMMGQIIKKYRASGVILTAKPNDVDSGFLKYLALTQWKDSGKMDAAFNTVLSFERNVTKWQGLAIAVSQWEEWLKDEEGQVTDVSKRGTGKGASKDDEAIAIKLMAQRAVENAARFKCAARVVEDIERANIQAKGVTPIAVDSSPEPVPFERKPLDPSKLSPEILEIMERAKAKAEVLNLQENQEN
jgi:hypothetical protein